MLSIIPTIIMLFLDFKSDLLLLIVLFNALGSCVDIFSCVLILLQVPKEGLVSTNSEEKTYWKVLKSRMDNCDNYMSIPVMNENE